MLTGLRLNRNYTVIPMIILSISFLQFNFMHETDMKTSMQLQSNGETTGVKQYLDLR